MLKMVKIQGYRDALVRQRNNMAIKNDVKNINSTCQVVVFDWIHNTLSDSLSTANVSRAISKDISRYITNVEFTKNIGAPSGTFSVSLPNNKDWKDEIKAGSCPTLP